MTQSKKGILAVSQPEFKKIETEMKNGIALNSNRVNLIALELMMDYNYNGTILVAGLDKVLVRADSGVQAWAKQVVKYNGKEFVFCPEDAIYGIEIKK